MQYLRSRYALLLVFTLLTTSAFATTITVDDPTDTTHNTLPADCSNSGSSPCSLHDAINYANSHGPGPHTINFSIATVNLTSSLPTISVPVTIDGSFGAPRVEIIGGPGISGFDIGSSAGGVLPGSGTTIEHLVIEKMSGDGISITDGGNKVIDCYIGTDKTGLTAQGNGGHGVSITTTSGSAYTLPFDPTGIGFNYIGDPADPTSGNLISGNTNDGVNISSQRTVLNVVAWNKIGTDKTGNAAIANGGNGVTITGSAFDNTIGPGNIISGNSGVNSDGINITGSVLLPNIISTNIIGTSSTLLINLGNGRDGIRLDSTLADISTPDAAEITLGNIIGFNGEDGIQITGGCAKVRVIGNFIGVGQDPSNSSNFLDIGNVRDGIRISTAGHQIGGGTPVVETNVISANNGSGITLLAGATDVNVQGNIIGRDPTNSINFSNTLDGITITSVGSNLIGGTGSGEGNTIAGNGRNGIKITSSGNGWSNLITQNSIFGNQQIQQGMGIDLDQAQENVDSTDNVTPGPDPNISYANYGQNAAVLTTATYNSGTGATTVNGLLTTAANLPVTIEVFGNDAPGFSNHGEGQKFLGSFTATTDGSGNLTLANSVTPSTAYDSRGKYITATVTATDAVAARPDSTAGPSNNTSEFSNAVLVPDPVTHFSISAPTPVTAGNAFNFTITALTGTNAVGTTYSGTVHFTTTDAQGVLPGDTTLVAGVGTFSATLKTAGIQTITGTDTVDNAITGTSNNIQVDAAGATHFTVTAPASATAGVAFNFNVTALDQFNNTATGYAGTVHFTSSDGLGIVPANSALVNGTGTFSATLKTAGNQTLTATDTVTPAITGTSGPIAVSAGAATHFTVSAPASATAGASFNFNVTALDAFNNTDTGYAGAVHFTSSDGLAVVPANSTLTNGAGTFSATLKTAGNQTLTATDTLTPAITGTSGPIAVSAAAATHFTISAPASATAGVSFNFTVTAQDPFNNTATGYAGTVHITTTDAQAVLPADSTLTNGVGTFSATLKTAGSQTLTGTDTVTPAITGTSGPINVSAAAATAFTVVAPGTAGPGVAFNFTVTALDAFNNTATGYAGTVHFTSTDGAGVVPANSTLTNGAGTFSATLNTAGNQTLTATDTVTPAITGTSNTIVVSAAVATHFSIVAPPGAFAGVSFNFTVTAQTATNATATGYAGTVHFTSSDGLAVVPADYTFVAGDNGAHTFSATLDTTGSQTITGTDTVTASITGVSNSILVSAGPATHFTVAAPASATAGTPINFTVTALDAFNNTDTAYVGTVHFTSSDGAAALPVDSTLTNGVGTFPATLNTNGNQTITGTDTVTASITGTSANILVGSVPVATHFSVTAPASATQGVSFNFTVTALDASNATVTGYAGTVHFTSSDGAGVVPVNSTLVNGTGTFSATLNTLGNQTLTATDTVTASITGTSGNINVTAVPPVATHFSVTAPASAAPGVAFNFTVTALDAGNATVTGYAGTVHFTSSDGAAVVPANSTLVNGTGTFAATLNTLGNQTITGTDTVTASITGTSGNINVTAVPPVATHFSVTAPAAATAGSPFNFTITALDASNATVTGYAGTVHFTSSDGAAVLPANSTLVNGTGTFAATLNTLGNQTITGTDTVTASITGTSNVINVTATPVATHFSITAPATAVAGTAFNFTITALDASNATVTGYAGTVHFTSTDGGAVLPANTTLVNGTGTFAATMHTAGNQMITGTDTVTASITGTSNVIAVSAGPATHFVVLAPAIVNPGSAFNFNVTALDAFNNTATAYAGTVHFTSTDPAAALPANSTLVNGTKAFSATMNTAGVQTITGTDTVTASITGTSGPISVSATGAAIPTLSWEALLALIAVLGAIGFIAIKKA